MTQREQISSDATKRERLEVRVSVEQKELVQRAAALLGRSVSDFVLESAQRAAEEAIREHAIIMLSVQDSQAFAKAVLNPPPPSQRLRAAVARYLNDTEEQ